jgi:hypothetical protein
LDSLIATSTDLAGDRTVIACAEGVRPDVADASNEIEMTRRLPSALLDKLHEARLFRLLLPRSTDGIETDPVTFFHVIETIAKADASTAWCLSQAGGCAMSAAYLDLPVARAVFGDRRAVLAWGPAPRSARSNVTAATGSRGFGPLPPAGDKRPGSARIVRSIRPMVRRNRTQRAASAPCWCEPRTSNGPTSGTPSACAGQPATSSR